MKKNTRKPKGAAAVAVQRLVRHPVSSLPIASSKTNATLLPEHILEPLKSLTQESFDSEVRRRRRLLRRSPNEQVSRVVRALARGVGLRMFWQAEYTKRHNRFLSWMERVCPSVAATYSSRYEAARHTDATTRQIL